MPEVGFGYFGMLGLGNVGGNMGSAAGYAEPIARCDWLPRMVAVV
jgi:hypothetical protein